MKNVLLAFMHLITFNIAQVQLSGNYVADFTKETEYYLNFLDDGQYYINILKHLTLDILDQRTMSIGHYSVQGKEITLIDKINNFKIKLINDHDSLKMEKTFSFMAAKTFIFNSTYVDEYPLNCLKNIDSLLVSKERAEYKNRNKKMYSLNYGNYFAKKCGFANWSII